MAQETSDVSGRPESDGILIYDEAHVYPSWVYFYYLEAMNMRENFERDRRGPSEQQIRAEKLRQKNAWLQSISRKHAGNKNA